jgi:hypothetical protein
VESGIPKNTPVEISRGYVEISRGRVLKSAGGMSKSAMPPCRNQQHIDNMEQQTIIGNREHKTIKSAIEQKQLPLLLSTLSGASCNCKQIARSKFSLFLFRLAVNVDFSNQIISMTMNRITDKTLYDFCVLYRQQFGQIQDATLFRNELGLRFYHDTKDVQELFDRCIRLRYLKCNAGDIIIKVGGKA